MSELSWSAVGQQFMEAALFEGLPDNARCYLIGAAGGYIHAKDAEELAVFFAPQFSRNVWQATLQALQTIAEVDEVSPEPFAEAIGAVLRDTPPTDVPERVFLANAATTALLLGLPVAAEVAAADTTQRVLGWRLARVSAANRGHAIYSRALVPEGADVGR